MDHKKTKAYAVLDVSEKSVSKKMKAMGTERRATMKYDLIEMQLLEGEELFNINGSCPNKTICIILFCGDSGCGDCMCGFDIGCDPFGPESSGGKIRTR